MAMIYIPVGIIMRCHYVSLTDDHISTTQAGQSEEAHRETVPETHAPQSTHFPMTTDIQNKRC
jgi:hypothetical protein